MIVIYQNAAGKEVRIRNVIHLQNIENGMLEAVTENDKLLTLRFDRVEAIVDESLFEGSDRGEQT